MNEKGYEVNQIQSRLKDNNNSELMEVFPFKSNFQFANGDQLNNEIPKFWL